MKQTYKELQITPSGEFDTFADFILSLTNEAIEEKDGSIIVRTEEDTQNIIFGIELFSKSLGESLGKTINVAIKEEQKENIDWIENYKNSVQALDVGRFYIHPSWEEGKKDKINICIDPALAFGSGHHESTYGCLLMVEKYLQKDARVLDVGCGSGILSIAAKKLGASVAICDTDELAVSSAKSNFTLNGVKVDQAWVGSVTDTKSSYDMVVANIIADVLIMLAKDLIRTVKKDGTLILSGVLEKYLNRVKERFSSLQMQEIYKKDEWYTLVLKKKETDESKQ